MPRPAPEIAILQHLDLMQGAVPLTNQPRPATGQLAQCRAAICLGRGPQAAFCACGQPTEGLDLDLVGDGFSIRVVISWRRGPPESRAPAFQKRRPIQLGKSRKLPLDIGGRPAVMAPALPVRQRSDSGTRRRFGVSFNAVADSSEPRQRGSRGTGQPAKLRLSAAISRPAPAFNSRTRRSLVCASGHAGRLGPSSRPIWAHSDWVSSP